MRLTAAGYIIEADNEHFIDFLIPHNSDTISGDIEVEIHDSER